MCCTKMILLQSSGAECTRIRPSLTPMNRDGAGLGITTRNAAVKVTFQEKRLAVS